MKTNSSISTSKKAALSLICQLSVAVFAELLLGAFVSEGNAAGILPRIVRAGSIFGTLFVLHQFAHAALPGYRNKNVRGVVWVHVLLLFSIALTATTKVLAFGLMSYGEATKVWPGLTEGTLEFAFPSTTAVLIIQSIFGLQTGMVISLLNSIVLSQYAPTPTLSILILLSTALVGCLSFMRVRSRSAYLKAALNIALVAMPFAVASAVISPISTPMDAVIRIVGCLVGGCLSAFMAVGATPIVEYLGQYASDMRLIEMATLDHPLLKELSVQAPGTWNHSMVMGMMVESAADAIKANPVVCRVGAYFHDIGKSKKPLYFVENQTPGENRHDKLSPSMSALIIRSHVKDGVELAKKHKLPALIEDMIPQHHGTSVIEYFFDKARKEIEEQGGDPDTVDVSLYSYPGPKPQTREAGLLMLADGIEAAARTLQDPTSDRIQGMVQKMINKVFASGQLNECELTLRDLHLIAKCFTRVLTGIYHQRIQYSEPAEKIADSGEENEGENQDERSSPHKKPKPEEDLKRLGLE
jgi:putative nucleotidyltransferase with HDIG domain